MLLQGRASTMAEGHRGHWIPSTLSSSLCPSHPSPCPSTSKTGTTSVWELRRMERRWGFVPCQVRISTTRPWHTCGRKVGCHQGPEWGHKVWTSRLEPKSISLGKVSGCHLPVLSPAGLSEPSQSPAAGAKCGCNSKEGRQTHHLPLVPRSLPGQQVPSRKDGPSQRDTARSPANHSTGSCKGQ